MNARAPKISVIIPVYNTAAFIRAAVESALAQTYPSFEIVVVDDGSTDGTAEMLSDLTDPRLRIVRQENQGVSAARNAGERLTAGELIAFLDADDLWAPHNLERQAAFLASHPEVDMTFGHSLVIDERGRSTGFKSSSIAGPVSFERLLGGNAVGNGSCALVRREALKQIGCFDTALSHCEDFYAWLSIANLRNANIAAIPEVLTFYRRHKDQQSGDWRQMEVCYLRILERVRQISPRLHLRYEYRGRSFRYLNYGRLARDRRQSGAAVRLIAIAWCWSPMWVLFNANAWMLGSSIVCQVILPQSWYVRAVRWGQPRIGRLIS